MNSNTSTLSRPATSTQSSAAKGQKVPDRMPFRPLSINESRPDPRYVQQTASAERLIPFAFPPLLFRTSESPLTSLAPSSAQGKPIIVADSATAPGRSALSQINHTFPATIASHRYTKSTSAQSTTHSQPVVVRTYTRAQGHSRSRSAVTRQGRQPSVEPHRRFAFGRVANTEPSSSNPITLFLSANPARRWIPRSNNGASSTMPRGPSKTPSKWPWKKGQDPGNGDKLPPMEAYTFKGLMSDLGDDEEDVIKAIDGIAEIYARSKYSLSNQYEVHVQPHGTGDSFLNGPPPSIPRRRAHSRHPHRRQQSQGGPTLQAVQSDDDESRRRRGFGANRRRSAAYGKLETIMSSSRSSEEDKQKKKSAVELQEQVRGRAASKSSNDKSASPEQYTSNSAEDQQVSLAQSKTTRRKSSTFANAILMAGTQQNTLTTSDGNNAPYSSTAALVGSPALPQSSSSHIEINTQPQHGIDDEVQSTSRDFSPRRSRLALAQEVAQTVSLIEESLADQHSFLSGLGLWTPWRAATADLDADVIPRRSQAEGSLRELLRGSEPRG